MDVSVSIRARVEALLIPAQGPAGLAVYAYFSPMTRGRRRSCELCRQIYLGTATTDSPLNGGHSTCDEVAELPPSADCTRWANLTAKTSCVPRMFVH